MKSIAIYGKGGAGKSMITSNLSVQFATLGRRIIQIGCDPKRDSTLTLTGGRPVPSVIAASRAAAGRPLSTSEFVFEGLHGIACVEAGGPEPGVGCAGRGIVHVFNLLEKHRVLDSYDVVLLDVLGDVVCGGFASPLMHGFASTVAIVVADNPMSIYAANNIAKAIRRFERNGTHLAGVIANNIRGGTRTWDLDAFAQLLDTTVLARIPHDQRILDAEADRVPVCERAPESDLGQLFTALAIRLQEIEPAQCPTPQPLDDDALDDFFRLASAPSEPE